MYRIKIDRSRCIGCLTCVTACVVSHESNDARNRVVIDSEGKCAPIFCRHCDRPECVYTCMTGAMHKNPENGFVEYDREKCASCYMCVMACPYGAISLESIGLPSATSETMAQKSMRSVAVRCDLCKDWMKREGKSVPACVEACPVHARSVVQIG